MSLDNKRGQVLCVGMYLRQTRRTNRDGSTVSYVQLAHNERHPVTGAPTAKVIHNFGRADKVDHEALKRLVASISRFLSPEQALVAAAEGEVEILDSRRLGGAWTLDQVWTRLGIGAAIHRVAEERRLDGQMVERVIFALVAQRCLEPGSKLAATGWVADRVAIESMTEPTSHPSRVAEDLNACGPRRPGPMHAPYCVLARALRTWFERAAPCPC